MTIYTWKLVVITSYIQWRRSVVKYGGQGHSGQTIKVFQITPYVNVKLRLHRTLSNPGSWQPVGRLEKLVLPSISGTSRSSLMMWSLQSYPTTVLNERMWHFWGVKTYSDPPTYFRGGEGQDPQHPRIYASGHIHWWKELIEELSVYSWSETVIHVDNDDDRNFSIRIKAISTHDGPKHTYMDCNYLSVCLSVCLSLSLSLSLSIRPRSQCWPHTL